MTLRDAAPTLGVFAVALAYLLLLRPYGFQLEDEGTLLSWFDRVARGQRPYVDFHTGYTPGFFAFGSAVFSLFGTSATALRAVLAVINALAAAGLTEATRRIAGRRLAPIPALVWLAFVPVYSGEFAAFNIPYPTWPVTLAWVMLALAMLSWAARPRAGLLVLAGAAAAFAMWFRPNSGAFALAGATWVVVAFASRCTRYDRVTAPLAAAFMAYGLWYTFEFRIVGMDAFVHLLPAFVLAALCAGPLSDRLRSNDAPQAGVSLEILAAAFVLPTLAWIVPLERSLGIDRLLYEVFLVGADYQTLYYKPHPAPEPYAVLVVAALLAIALGGRMVARRRVSPLLVLIGFLTAGAVAALLLARGGVAPEGVVRSINAQLENASYWLAATASFGAVAWLIRAPAAELRSSPRARALVVLTPLAVAMYAQMFPRSDFMHQVQAVPLLAVVACGLLGRVAAWWAAGTWPRALDGRQAVRGGLLAAAAVVLAIAFSEKIVGPVAAWSGAAPAGSISDRLDVHVEAAAGDELEAIAAAVAFLHAHTSDGEALWSFPATSGVLFAAGRTNLAPHDYWYPGRPDRAEENRVLGLLREHRPRFIVTLGHGWNFFAGAPTYFDYLRRHVADEYRLAARFGRYDILARRDLAEAGFAEPATMPPRPGPREGVFDENLERRRQAARRWMDAMTPAEAAGAVLPTGKRDALLLLRALRDGGDMRGAGWAILGFESDDPRIRGEAVDAMHALARSLEDERARFANDFDAGRYRAYVAPWSQHARRLESVEALKPFAAAVLELAETPDPS
ncbi:MAG: hypothetical protein ABR587_10615 [Candidatus Binatia bacterium]